jgi:DNA repair protein RadC
MHELLAKSSGKSSSSHSTIKEWPSDERPREKLLNHGPEVLSESELLGILIGSGTGKATAVDLAKSILIEHRTLRSLAGLTAADFQQFKGIGEARAVTIVAAFELARRVQSTHENKKKAIQSPADISSIFIPKLEHLKQEVFIVVLLNGANNIIKEATITKGLLNSSLTHPREVFRPAILEQAASVILVHNHPSGNGEPSKEDIVITKQMVEAGKVIGIPVHDHIIIAGNGYTSFAERNLL